MLVSWTSPGETSSKSVVIIKKIHICCLMVFCRPLRIKGYVYLIQSATVNSIYTAAANQCLDSNGVALALDANIESWSMSVVWTTDSPNVLNEYRYRLTYLRGSMRCNEHWLTAWSSCSLRGFYQSKKIFYGKQPDLEPSPSSPLIEGRGKVQLPINSRSCSWAASSITNDAWNQQTYYSLRVLRANNFVERFCLTRLLTRRLPSDTRGLLTAICCLFVVWLLADLSHADSLSHLSDARKKNERTNLRWKLWPRCSADGLP